MIEHGNVITKIGLGKLFLWMEAERIESYPEAFSKLNSGKIYSMDTLIREVFGLIYNDQSVSNQPVRSDFLRNLFGLELTSPTKISIRGINALQEIEPKKFIPTQMAMEIGQAYLSSDKSVWSQGLAKMIACYEVRTRLLLFLLGKCGYSLVFPSQDFFGTPSIHTELVRASDKIHLFAQDSKEFNALLQENRWIALGPWWMQIIHTKGIEVATDFTFEGLRDPKPPTNKLNSRIKISLHLLKHLGILETQAGEWRVNPIQATAVLGEDIAQDFVEVTYDRSPFHHLHQWQANLQDSLGFIVVADLVQQWKDLNGLTTAQAEIDFDNWMRQQVYLGRVRILEMHAGQPRLGRGLYGDDTARKIRFEVFEA